MLWFYTREKQSLTVETRYDNETKEYVATIIGLAGVQDTRRFKTAETFREWLLTLERNLTEENWRPDGSPHVLPDGWPDKPPPR